MQEFSVKQLKDKLDSNDDSLFLLDVREPWEHELACIENSKLIPLMQLPTRWSELPQDKTIVVYCHHGGRSAHACMFLNAQGFQKVYNLAGGIDAWAISIDSEVKRY